MEVMYQRCCGLDVHKKLVVACVITPEGKETRTFGTMTENLLELGDWLADCGVTHVAMESTGVYWKPIYNLLEDNFELLVVNARHIKAVPGRKTDVKDAEWLADLLRHGLVRSSFIPGRPQRELRELLRYRRGLIQERSRVTNTIEKVLEGANIKLGAVATDILGVSGRAMLKAMANGTDDPQLLADLAQGTLKQKHTALTQALRGLVGPHQRMMLQSQLRHLAFLDGEVKDVSSEVAKRMEPFQDEITRIDEIPGVGTVVAQNILGEIGLNMGQFPSAKHISSWAGVCPGNNMSAGKRKTGRTGHGNPWLSSALVEAAWAAVKVKASYFSAQYHRLAARRGSKRAIVAVAHSLLVTIYYMLTRGTRFQDLGSNFFDDRNRDKVVARILRRIERLGYKVTIQDAAA